MERKILEFPNENEKNWGECAAGKAQLAESELTVDLSMGRNVIEIRKEPETFRVSIVLTEKSQLAELELMVDLSTGRKAIAIPLEIKDFGGQLC